MRPLLNQKTFHVQLEFHHSFRQKQYNPHQEGIEIALSKSLDELPELINIIKGEMSFIGPRPLLMEYLKLYTDYQSKRHNMKPGITGLAQVNGRNAISWSKRFSLDVKYVRRKSFLMDLKILKNLILNYWQRK